MLATPLEIRFFIQMAFFKDGGRALPRNSQNLPWTNRSCNGEQYRSSGYQDHSVQTHSCSFIRIFHCCHYQKSVIFSKFDLAIFWNNCNVSAISTFNINLIYYHSFKVYFLSISKKDFMQLDNIDFMSVTIT